MQRTQRAVMLAMIVVMFTVGTVLAQSPQYRPVDNPFQEGFDYALGESLTPNVEIDGLRWSLVRIALRGGGDVETGKDNAVEITLELESVRQDNATAQVILLLEDSRGTPLDRIELGNVKVPGGRFKSDTQKTKIAGESLRALTRLYLFCEVLD